MPSEELTPFDAEIPLSSADPTFPVETWGKLANETLPWAIKADESSSLPMALPGDEELPKVLRIPKRPQPGFWFSCLLCVAYLITTQVLPAMAVVCVMLVMQMISMGSVQEGINEMLGDKGREFSRRILMPSLFAAQVCGVLFSLFMIRVFMGKDWSRKIALRRPGLVHLILVLIGFPSLPILASGIFELTKHFLPSFAQLLKPLMPSFIGWPSLFGFHLDQDIMGMEDLVKEIRTWPWQLAVLVIGLGPGINEELWCRGFLGRGLVARYGYVGGIVLTSIFFGILHIDPQQGFMAACMGLALHYTYIMTRSLWVPMLLHFMNNSLSAIAGHLGSEFEKIDTAGHTIPVTLYLGSAALMAAVGYALYVSRTRLVPASDKIRFTWQPDYPGVEYPPKESGTIVVRPWPSLKAWGLVALSFMLFLASAYRTFSQQY